MKKELSIQAGNNILEAKRSSGSNGTRLSSTFWVGFLLVQASFLVCLVLVLSYFPSANQGGLPAEGSDWGANVTMSGHTVPVISWFDDQLIADNVKNNLQ